MNESAPACYNLNADLLSINETGHSYLRESNVNNNFVLMENCVAFPFGDQSPKFDVFHCEFNESHKQSRHEKREFDSEVQSWLI